MPFLGSPTRAPTVLGYHVPVWGGSPVFPLCEAVPGAGAVYTQQTLPQAAETSGNGCVSPICLLKKAFLQCSELCPLILSLWDPGMAPLAFLGQPRSAQWFKGTQVRPDRTQSSTCPPETQEPFLVTSSGLCPALKAHKDFLFHL